MYCSHDGFCWTSVGFCYELVSVVFVVVLPHELYLFIVEIVCVSKLE